MKTFLLAFLLTAAVHSQGQYFYKDIIGTRETAELIKTYKTNRVSRVVLTSFDEQNTKSDDFYVEQIFSPATQTLKTITRSGVSIGSVLTSFLDARGNVIKTIDSSETNTSTTLYHYNDAGLLISVRSSSNDTANVILEGEEHRWEYVNNKVSRMLRIKGGRDTTYVQFKLDDNSNVTEELATRKGLKSEPVYYYYDANNRLTDIVRFNNKAKRLLPEYMFEYSPANQVIQRITVPANGSDYLIWRYQYDTRGLKIKEAVFDKHKQLTGKIEYQYQFE